MIDSPVYYSTRTKLYNSLIILLWDSVWKSVPPKEKYLVQTNIRDTVSQSIEFSLSFRINHIVHIKLNEL